MLSAVAWENRMLGDITLDDVKADGHHGMYTKKYIYWPPKFVGSSDPRVIFASQGIEYRLQSPEKHNK